MRRPSPIVGAAVLVTALSSLLLPSTAHAVDADQSLVVSGVAADWSPQVLDGQVNAIAAVGTDIVIGGTFTQVKDAGASGATYDRPYIAALDASTGKIDPDFDPTFGGITSDELAAGHGIDALAANAGNVVVGGVFNAVDGVTQHGITELTLDGARVSAFAADLNGTNKQVGALVVNGGKVYVGGKFDKVNSVARSGLAVLNAGTGAVQPLNLAVTGTLQPGATSSVVSLDVTPDGRTLVIGGNFTTVAGAARTQLALIDTASGRLTSWQTTDFNTPCLAGVSDVRQLDISPDGAYFVVAAGGGPKTGSLCDAASRWELGRTGTGQHPTWVDSTGGDTLTSVAITGTAVYVGGHQRWVNNYYGNNLNEPGAVDRKMVAALDPTTGLPLSWNPAVTRGGEGIYDMLATPSGLWVGSDDDIAFPGHKKLVFFPVAGGSTVPNVQPQTLPRTLYTTTTGNGLLRRSYDGSTFGSTSAVPSAGAVAWGSVDGAFMLSGSVYYGTTDGVLHKAPFDGSTVGASSVVSTFWSTTGVKSFTYGNGRLYYVGSDGSLYYRWFSNESDVVGSEPVQAATGYGSATELFVANGSLYFAKPDTKLYRVPLSPATGLPTVPAASATAVSGPGIDALTWTDTAAFLSSTPVKSFLRLYGADRVATSIAVSQDEFTADGSAGAVVLARSDAFPDGLAGAPLAYRTHAPVLLTAPTTLDPRVANEIKRVLAGGGTVYELGGTASISAAVDTAVHNLGYTTVRLGGVDRYGTSIAIASKILTLSGGASKALVVTGQEFPDALGAGAAASADGVVLLTNGASMPASVAGFLTAHPGLQVWGVGGKGAAAAKAYDPALPAGRTLIGIDRTQTATLLADAFFAAPTDVVLVNSQNFPDGLSGGPYAAAKGGPVLLTATSPLGSYVQTYLAAHAATIAQGQVLGGPAMVSGATMTSAEAAAS